jgi:hypothetical protein
MFLAFDYPTPFTTAGRRGTSNVPAQALVLLNNPFIFQQSNVWANRACRVIRAISPKLRRGDAESCARIDWLYETAFGRLPTDREKAAALRFLTTASGVENGKTDPVAAWSDLCHTLFNVKAFVYIH